MIKSNGKFECTDSKFWSRKSNPKNWIKTLKQDAWNNKEAKPTPKWQCPHQNGESAICSCIHLMQADIDGKSRGAETSQNWVDFIIILAV